MRQTKAREIQERIRQVLLHDWDPIGVADIEEAQDEYDSYVGLVYRLLASPASEDELIAELRHIEVVRMGLSPVRPEGLLPVARKLKALDVSLGPDEPAA